jgi:hypothetical protein
MYSEPLKQKGICFIILVKQEQHHMARTNSRRRLTGLDPAVPYHENLGVDWRVTYQFGRTQTGALAVARLEIAPRREAATVPADGLVSPLFGRIKIASVRRRLRAIIDPTAANTTPLSGAATLTVTAAGALTSTKRKRGRPAVVKQPEYVRIRDRYMELIAPGQDDPHPPLTLAQEFGISREAMRSRLHRMRKRGLFNRVIPVTDVPTATVHRRRT